MSESELAVVRAILYVIIPLLFFGCLQLAGAVTELRKEIEKLKRESEGRRIGLVDAKARARRT